VLPIQVGIDVAGPGEDETVVVARAGGAILETHVFPDHDPRGRVAQVLGQLRQTGRLLHVVVDGVGIGYNFALHLADLGFPAFLFIAGDRAIDAERFVNAKAEAYWVCVNGWIKTAFAGSTISKWRLSSRRSSNGQLHRVKRKSKARKRRESADSRRPIALKRSPWLFVKSSRENRRSFSTSAS
jgi:hypothetical protein